MNYNYYRRLKTRYTYRNDDLVAVTYDFFLTFFLSAQLSI